MKSILLFCVFILIILSACKDNTFIEEPIPVGFSEYICYPGSNPKIWAHDCNLYCLYNIFFIDKKHGWILNENDSILRTTDGGKSWEKYFIEHSETSGYTFKGHFNTLYFKDTLNGWVGDANNGLYKTTDGGKSWTKKVLFTEQMDRGIYDIQFTDEMTGWATIKNGSSDDAIIKTTDGGNNWEINLTDFEDGIDDLHFTNKTTAFFQTFHRISQKTNSRIYKTTDEGKTWFEVFKDTTIALYQSFFLDENNAWIKTDEYKFLRTSDGGFNWFYQNYNSERYISNFTFVDENHGWGISSLPNYLYGGTKYHLISFTEDGGINWLPLNYWVSLSEPNGIVHFHDLFFFDKNEGFISGSKGVILHTTTGGKP
ncbi:MAG: hypothetical protein A2X61_02375 [Ignavibacteria bacterium GWB2_35_12]|nr:MAG: hypothetical protein A2X63_03550 [Ignavibacteria bacterium GWA2_35_8]OGU42428.1 MAG: hypothetical protein A2X61_02375 [Ignavibacteria bacterium GWB2_35_12]OGU96597.1 MAG: hypothetical protein A2220_11960 [Ignavibacteria bacterium RIFOXYA2_FULL_35_10]OGV24208.1 MAG: hypothetical protein A2475_08305 [Ignavibacteria bacterium RIFOXYC2_FULL_35_21]